MTYPEYKTAAERHLETCWQIVEKLNQYEEKAKYNNLNGQEERSQNFLLSNLYYLSGYMLECLYNYAVCKYEDRRTGNSITGVLKLALDNATVGTYNVCFSKNKRTPLRVSFSLERDRHRMSLSDLSFFSQNNRHDFSINAINILQNIDFPDTNTKILLRCWTVYERYKINNDAATDFPLPLTYQNIVKFFWELVAVCAKISEHIIREITPFRKIIKKRPSNI